MLHAGEIVPQFHLYNKRRTINLKLLDSMLKYIQGFAGCFGVRNEKASFDQERMSNCSSRAIYMAALSHAKDPATNSAQSDIHKRTVRPEWVLLITWLTAGEDCKTVWWKTALGIKKGKQNTSLKSLLCSTSHPKFHKYIITRASRDKRKEKTEWRTWKMRKQ